MRSGHRVEEKRKVQVNLCRKSNHKLRLHPRSACGILTNGKTTKVSSRSQNESPRSGYFWGIFAISGFPAAGFRPSGCTVAVSVQPFADVVGYYICRNRDNECNDQGEQHSDPPFQSKGSTARPVYQIRQGFTRNGFVTTCPFLRLCSAEAPQIPFFPYQKTCNPRPFPLYCSQSQGKGGERP